MWEGVKRNREGERNNKKKRYERKGTKKMSLERERLNRGEGEKRDKYRDRT